MNLSNFIFKIFTTRNSCFLQFFHNDRKIFLNMYDFFKSSSIILWVLKFSAIDPIKYSDNQIIFSSKSSRFQLCLKNCIKSKIRIFLIHKYEELLEFNFEDLLTCCKNIKEFYITYVSSKQPWIYLREKRLGKFFNITFLTPIMQILTLLTLSPTGGPLRPTPSAICDCSKTH